MSTYRSAPESDTALPFARARLAPWTTTLAVAASIAALLPGLLFRWILARSEDSPDGAKTVLVVDMAVCGALALAGIGMARGRRVPPVALLAIAFVPLVLGVLFVDGVTSAAAPALESASAAALPYVLARTLAAMEASVFYAVTCAAAACALAALACVASTATIDLTRTKTGPGPLATALVGGVPWFAASFLARVAFAKAVPSGVLLGISLVLPLAGATVAAMLAWSCGALRGESLRQEKTWLVTAMGTAAVAMLGTTLFFDRALAAAAAHESYLTLADAGLAPLARRAAVDALGAAGRPQAIVAAVDALGCLACFAVPIVFALRAARRALDRRLVALVGGAALLVVPVVPLVARSLVDKLEARVAYTAMAREWMNGDVEESWFHLPVVPPKTRWAAPPGSKRTKIVFDDPNRRLYVPDGGEVFADQRVPFWQLARIATADKRPRPWVFVAHGEGMAAPPERDELRALAGTPEWGFPVAIAAGAPLPPADATVTLDDTTNARVDFREGQLAFIPLGGGEDATERRLALDRTFAASPLATITIVVRAKDTVQRMVTVLAALSDPETYPERYRAPSRTFTLSGPAYVRDFTL